MRNPIASAQQEWTQSGTIEETQFNCFLIEVDMLFIFIAGQSGSCKTWFANLLFNQLNSLHIRTKMISMDDYYKSKEELGGGVIDYDKLGWNALNLTLFYQHLNQLNNGQVVKTPVYHFIQEKSFTDINTIDPAQDDVVIIEGIFALRPDQALDSITNKLKYFIESDSYLEYMKRRVKRDIAERGKTLEEIKKKELKAFGVRDTFFNSILPTRIHADDTITYNDHTSSEAILAEVLPDIIRKCRSDNALLRKA